MDFVFVLLFQALYFLRPQDWIPGLGGAPFVSLVMLGAMISLWIRPGGVSLRDLFRTPHDALMYLYFAWIVYAAKDPVGMMKTLFPFLMFYLVTLLSLTSIARLHRFLRFWCAMLATLAGMGILTAYGFDFTGAAELIQINDGRLCLNTWMHNNPNALGHSLIVTVPAALFLYLWRSPHTLGRGFGLAFLGAYAVYLTQSKGAMLVGMAVSLLAFLFGLPRIFQIIGSLLAILASSTMISLLPRMESLSRSDQGIQGRVLAWNCALESLRRWPDGVGWKQFIARFMWEGEEVTKATHSSYVQIGAALGHVGLFLYLGVLYSWVRTLIFVRPANLEEDRIRRVLIAFSAAFMLSNWMIDRAYHAEFFLLAAAVAAYHRLAVLRIGVPEGGEKSDRPALAGAQPSVGSALPAPVAEGTALVPAPAWSLGSGALAPTASPVFLQPGETRGQRSPPDLAGNPITARFLRWERPQLIDLPFIYLAYWLVLEIWTYVVTHF